MAHNYTIQVETRSKGVLRTIGQIQLCGVLYGAWQTREGVDGKYFITLLYRDYLIFASTTKFEQKYTVQVSIGLGTVRVENTDVGRGKWAVAQNLLTSYALEIPLHFVNENINAAILPLRGNHLLTSSRATMPYSTILVENFI